MSENNQFETKVNDQHLLINSKLLSDVSFIVGPKRLHIYGHRYPLLLASDVFNRMFSSDLVPRTGEQVEVPDIDADTFLVMLKFVYGDVPAITAENVVRVYYAADKYNLSGLISRCLQFIGREEESVLRIFTANIEYRFDRLDRECLKTILANPLKIFKSPAFLELPLELMKKLAAQGQRRCNDDQLLEALKRWSEHRKGELIDRHGTLNKLTAIVEKQRELNRDHLCRKWSIFGRMVSLLSVPDIEFSITALKPIDLYGIGVFVGMKDAKDNPSSLESTFLTFSFSITDRFGKKVELWTAQAPYREDIYVYDYMFERYSLKANDYVTLAYNSLYSSPSVAMELKDFTYSGDSSMMKLSLSGHSNFHTNVAYILYQVKQSNESL